jgi:hypothetical protein
MPTINAGSTFTTTIPAGTRFGMGRGTGTYRVGPIGASASPTIEELIDPEGTWLGPFSGDCSLTVRATTAVTYNTIAPFDALTQTQVVASPETAAALVSGDGNSQRSILSIGGDHPYAQWWGTNGSDGMAAMYKQLGIEPYLAICADESIDLTSGYGATLGKPQMLSIAQAQALEAQGVEFVSHGTRHTHWWELFNTGIRVYYTGAEATPTVNISTTQLTTSTATAGATAFTWAAYPTLAQLAAAINALAGWNCILATELLGSERSSMLVPLRAARSVVDAGAGDITDSNQRFALVAGIHIRYAGTAYRDVSISVNDGSNFFSLFADGARLLAQSTAATLQTIVNAINALNIVGLTALVMDNGYNAQTVAGSTALNPGQKFRETYCLGDEDGAALHRSVQLQSVNGMGVSVCAGMGLAYAIRRAVLGVKERAASLYGLTINGFAQSGGRLYPWHLRTVMDEHDSWRGNRSYTDLQNGLSPHAMPLNHRGKFVGHFTSIISSSPATPYGEADVKAVVEALADSDGWYVNWLQHLCTPTPGDPSPFAGMNQHPAGLYTSSADQDEGPFWRELQYAAAVRDAGAIDILPPSMAERVRATRRGPSNLVFNARLRNGRADDLRGITTTVQGAGGIACPGWAVNIATGDFSAATINAARELTLTTNGALGANRVPMGCHLFLEPGRTYDLGAFLDLSGWGAANAVRLVLYPLHGGFDQAFNLGLSSISSQPWYGGFCGDAAFSIVIPPRRPPQPARAIGIAGPFAFGGTDTLTVNIDNRGASAAIAVSGLTTAKAVAAAINTALAADATYATLAQYHNVARAQDNRLIIEAPLSGGAPNDSGSLTQLSNGVGTPLAVLFGAGVTAVRAAGKASDQWDTDLIGFRMALLPSSTAATQTLKMSAPYCREVLL